MALGIKCVREGCGHSGEECLLWNECPLFQADQRRPQRKSAKQVLLRPTEDDIQEAVVEYCDLMHIVCVHIPNESKRSQSYGAKMKRMGLRKGFPDLFIPVARQGFHGLFIELKRDKLARPTKEQLEWLSYLNREGYRAIIAYGVDEAMKEIKRYMGIR